MMRLNAFLISVGITLVEHGLPNPWHGMDTVAGCAYVAGGLMVYAMFWPSKKMTTFP